MDQSFTYYTSPAKRFFAYFIDAIIISALQAVILVLFFDELNLTLVPTSLSISISIITLIYYAGFHASPLQGTVGKWSMGIKLEKSNGDRPSILYTVARYILKIVLAIVLLVGFWWMFVDKKNRTLYDVILGLQVVDNY